MLKLQYFGHELRAWKDPDAGKDWRQEEKRMTEDELAGWHHRFNGHEFEQTPEDGEGQEKPGMLQSTGSQRVRQDWGTEQQQFMLKCIHMLKSSAPAP